MTIIFNKRSILRFFCYLLFSIMVLSGVCLAETVRIPVKYRVASEVLPFVKGMLSPTGEAVVDEMTNSLFITDNEKTIQKIRTFLPEVDVMGRQVRIRVKFQEIHLAGDRSLSAEGSVSGNAWEVSKGRRKREGLNIDVRNENSLKRRSSESFISVTSGSSAYILAGEDIPYHERWIYLSRRYAKLVDTVVFQRVETGFDVRPVVAGKIAHIDITPRISYVSSEEEEGTIHFTSAQTSLTVPLGQWVSIGGTSGKENEVLNAILECGRGDRNSSLSISLLVE
jgi:hypothetical protein